MACLSVVAAAGACRLAGRGAGGCCLGRGRGEHSELVVQQLVAGEELVGLGGCPLQLPRGLKCGLVSPSAGPAAFRCSAVVMIARPIGERRGTRASRVSFSISS